MADIEVVMTGAAQEQIDKILDNPMFKTEINGMFAKKCDPYVPYITGALASNITVDSTGITYNQPYAEDVYYSAGMHNTEHHPLASSRWDEVTVNNHREEIAQNIAEILRRWIKTKQ